MESKLFFKVIRDNEFRNFLPVGTIISTSLDGIIELCTSISTTNPPVEHKRKINLHKVDWAMLPMDINSVEKQTCGECWGSGWEIQFLKPCVKCNGSGIV